MMDHFLADLDVARGYSGDVIVFYTNLEENLDHISAVISVTSKYGLKLKLAKYHLA